MNDKKITRKRLFAALLVSALTILTPCAFSLNGGGGSNGVEAAEISPDTPANEQQAEGDLDDGNVSNDGDKPGNGNESGDRDKPGNGNVVTNVSCSVTAIIVFYDENGKMISSVPQDQFDLSEGDSINLSAIAPQNWHTWKIFILAEGTSGSKPEQLQISYMASSVQP